MITVEEAEKIILEHKIALDTEGVALQKSVGRVLREDLVADRDFPPFDRVTMDGIAFLHENFKAGQRIFNVAGVQAAGMSPMILTQKNACFEVMTGAVLPIGVDTVVRYEDLKIENQKAEMLAQNVDFQQNIHQKGIDRKADDVLLLRGRKITSAEIATAATVGKDELKVTRLPRTAIISTGDELVDVSENPLPHQIRRSNVYAIHAMLSEYKIDADLYHFNDDEAAITEGVARILAAYELVILSGAVSEGKFDFVPNVLNNLGVKKLFHKVSQRPGKPFWFGVSPNKTVIFALPGNPVSTFLCAYRYVLPWLKASLGLENERQEWAILGENITFKAALTYFIPVKLDVENAQNGLLFAKPLAGHGSGDLANLNDADGFLELPLAQDVFEKGGVFPFIRYRF